MHDIKDSLLHYSIFLFYVNAIIQFFHFCVLNFSSSSFFLWGWWEGWGCSLIAFFLLNLNFGVAVVVVIVVSVIYYLFVKHFIYLFFQSFLCLCFRFSRVNMEISFYCVMCRSIVVGNTMRIPRVVLGTMQISPIAAKCGRHERFLWYFLNIILKYNMICLI